MFRFKLENIDMPGINETGPTRDLKMKYRKLMFMRRHGYYYNPGFFFNCYSCCFFLFLVVFIAIYLKYLDIGPLQILGFNIFGEKGVIGLMILSSIFIIFFFYISLGPSKEYMKMKRLRDTDPIYNWHKNNKIKHRQYKGH